MNRPPPHTIRSLLFSGRRQLQQAGLAQASWDALILLAFLLNQEKEFVLSHPDQMIPAARVARFQKLLLARQQRTPLQYLCGTQEFWGRTFRVNPAVLIPRPETELLVERALACREKLKNLAQGGPLRVADIGTGSGCLAITLALELEGSSVLALDCSASALRTARRNARALAPSREIRFIRSDLVPPARARKAAGPFHLLVSNPPYVALGDKAGLDPEVRDFEPEEALFGGPDGLDVIRRIVPAAGELLVPGGLLLLEIGLGQSEAVLTLLAGNHWETKQVWPDLQGIPRCVEAWRKDCATGIHAL